MIYTVPRPSARPFCGIFAPSKTVLACFKATIESTKRNNRIAEHSNVQQLLKKKKTRGGGGEEGGRAFQMFLKHKNLKDQDIRAGQLTEEILTFEPNSPYSPPTTNVCANPTVCILRDSDIKPRFLPFYADEGNYSLRPNKRNW